MREVLLTRGKCVSLSDEKVGKSGKYRRFGLLDTLDNHVTECVIYEENNPNLYKNALRFLRREDRYNMRGKQSFFNKEIQTTSGPQYIQMECIIIKEIELDKDI